MTTNNYEIDILKNEIEGTKGQKISKLIYLSVFVFIGVFSIIYNFSKREPWTSYQIGLAAFGWAFISYLQLTGKWIYKRFISININNIKWREATYNFNNLKWTQINQVNFENSSIVFHLSNGNSKQFSLKRITEEQIIKLKELLSQFSNEKGIKYISK